VNPTAICRPSPACGGVEGGVAVDLLLPSQRAAVQVPNIDRIEIVVSVFKARAAQVGSARIFDENGHGSTQEHSAAAENDRRLKIRFSIRSVQHPQLRYPQHSVAAAFSSRSIQHRLPEAPAAPRHEARAVRCSSAVLGIGQNPVASRLRTL
jgi:hypothetical protein